MNNAIINLSLCLSDIPKEKLRKSEKNGKVYVNITVAPRKEEDKFGNNVYAIIQQTKEERADKKDKKYVGEGKFIDFSNMGSGSPENTVPVGEEEELPWD
jgi:hypothetical protein